MNLLSSFFIYKIFIKTFIEIGSSVEFGAMGRSRNFGAGQGGLGAMPWTTSPPLGIIPPIPAPLVLSNKSKLRGYSSMVERMLCKHEVIGSSPFTSKLARGLRGTLCF